MSETLSQNPGSSPDATTDWSVLEGDGRVVKPEDPFKKAIGDVIAARKELFDLSKLSIEHPEDDKAWQATREQSVVVQALIKRRNELAKQMTNNRPAESE